MQGYTEQLEELKRRDCFRSIPPIDYKQDAYAIVAGKPLLNLSSNDYLGLSTRTDVRREFLERYGNTEEFLFSAASARLLSGTSAVYARLEARTASLFGKEACLLFNSGYQCNLGVVSTLVGKGDVIFSDKLNHASIVAGMRASGADFFRYAHRDYDHLEKFLHQQRGKYRRALIISESVFSMDGDVADVDALIRLKRAHDALLMLDEAHAFGVFGQRLAGVGEDMDVDVVTATFGKSLASVGAFCVADKTVIDLLVNKAAPFIFSTALPPVNVLWTYFLLQERYALLQERRQALRQLCAALNSPTQILPTPVGDSAAAATLAARLREEGFFVLPIRPPTVPAGTARLRLSLTASMRAEDIRALLRRIEELR